MPGDDFVALGKLWPWFDRFSSKRRNRRSSLHPPSAGPGCHRLPLEASGLGTGNEESSTTTRQRITVSITQSRENKPFISVCHQLEVGTVGSASRSHRLPPAASLGVCRAGISQFAQDFLFSAFFWLFSSLSVDPPSDLARAVREARLEAEPKFPLLLFSAAPCSLRPLLRRRAGPAALRTLPGFTSNP